MNAETVLSVRDLTFVVDSPLDLNEFTYSQQVKLASPSSCVE